MNDMVVLEGLRTQKRQAQLLAAKKTKTMNSRHLTGHAVDLAPLIGGKVPCLPGTKTWDGAYFEKLSAFVFEAADELGVLLQWGGDWDMDGETRDESFFDGPHFQEPWPYKVELAKEAQKRRTMVGRLSRDITPGLTPEDMKDEEFDPGWPADLDLDGSDK
jgi:peptidoglycan L-alanyl-D-glutamate endopeptidase CwlK